MKRTPTLPLPCPRIFAMTLRYGARCRYGNCSCGLLARKSTMRECDLRSTEASKHGNITSDVTVNPLSAMPCAAEQAQLTRDGPGHNANFHPTTNVHFLKTHSRRSRHNMEIPVSLRTNTAFTYAVILAALKDF
ncbi:hypothetical protein CBL_09352 [Carabus blaptoides fortunei]